MSDWREPITDRILTDVKNADTGSLEYQKGALNADDLNRIEDNYKYLMAKLRSDAIFIPHRLRNFTETVLEYVEKGIEEPEHTVVEYIESDGNSYIDILFTPNQDTRIVLDFEVLEGNTTEAHICSVRTSGGTPLLTLFYSSTGKYSTRYGTGSVKTFSDISGAGRHLFDRNKNVLTVDEAYTITETYETFSVTSTVPIFCRNDGTEYNNPVIGRLRPSKIYDNGTLACDLVPVIDKNGEACVYDQLNNVYHYNLGTGTFIAGPEVPTETEPTYELVETTTTYTDWQEHNLPWLSEINRIRANYNALVRLFLIGLGLPVSVESNYLDYQEVNDWERIALVGKEMFENMEKEYLRCNTVICGGDILL